MNDDRDVHQDQGKGESTTNHMLIMLERPSNSTMSLNRHGSQVVTGCKEEYLHRQCRYPKFAVLLYRKVDK